jgi:hypothetical protein
MHALAKQGGASIRTHAKPDSGIPGAGNYKVGMEGS